MNMSESICEDRRISAQKFIIDAKDEFKKQIPRDTIMNIEVTDCIEKDRIISITGPVDAVSPTGKEKTYRYNAEVSVDADGVCSLVGLKVSDL